MKAQLAARLKEFKAANLVTIEAVEAKLTQDYYVNIVIVTDTPDAEDEVVVSEAVAVDVTEPVVDQPAREKVVDNLHQNEFIQYNDKLAFRHIGETLSQGADSVEELPEDEVELSDDPLYFNPEAVQEMEEQIDPDEEDVATDNLKIHGSVNDLFVSMFEEIETMGHVQEFDSNWGSPRRGYHGLIRAKNKGRGELFVSYNTAGQRLAVRRDADGVQVMYEREQRIELASCDGIEVVEDPSTVLAFFAI